MSMKVPEAGVIPADSSNQTNLSLLTSEARVALDQRLKLGHLANVLSKIVSYSIPFILHSILALPEPEIVGSPISAAVAVPCTQTS